MPSNDNIDAVLNTLGWNDGFRIPVANEENKQLEEEIEKKMQLKEDLFTKLEHVEERMKLMKKYINNLTTEQDINQKLLTTHAARLETEDHHYRLNCSTESSLRQEARNFEKEWRGINEIVLGIEENLRKLSKKIESSEKTLKYDKKSLQELEETLNKNEGNNKLIEQYMEDDFKEYKELELKRQNFNKELQTYREAILKVTNEVREMEVVLNRTTKLYDEALKEYRQIFNQWKESVIMLQQRNDEIEKILKDVGILREISQDKRKVLTESEKFLNEQIETNRQTEESIKKLEKNCFNLKEEQRKMKESFGMYEDEVLVQKNIVKDLVHSIQQVRTDIKCKESQIQNKQANIERMEKQITDFTIKLQNIDDQKLNVEEKANSLENMIQEQEKKKALIIKEVNRIQAANLRTTNQLKALENEHKILKMQYHNEYKKIQYLDVLYSKNEKVLEEKREGLYKVQFELQKSELKLERLSGHERDKTEAEKKQNKIEELENIVREKTEISKLLQKQIASLEYEMRKISNNLTNDNNELEYLKNKRQDLILLMDAGEKQLKYAQNNYEEKLVKESMLRLRLSQMEKLISNLGNNVYNLERYQLELEAAIRERKAEIAAEKESLNIQKRVASSECSEIKCAISERKARIKQLQARYDSSIATLGTNPDGSPVDTTYLKIQNAQERYILQEQGDKIDETIRKTEYEIQSMENTLRVINVCNDKYKGKLTTNDKNKPELEEHKKLDEEFLNAEKKMKLKQDELCCLKESLEDLHKDDTQIRKDIEETEELRKNKIQYAVNLKQQIKEQEEKILRAERVLQSAQKDIHQKYAVTRDKTLFLQQKEIELRELQEQNSIILQNIAEFTMHHVETEVYMKNLLAIKNMELPSALFLSQSPRSSQNCSSASTNSSEFRPKNISHASISGSSRERIGTVIHLQPQFEIMPNANSPNKNMKHEQCVRTSHKKSIKKT